MPEKAKNKIFTFLDSPKDVPLLAGLKSSVNLFRTMISFLSKDKSYLKNLQDHSSYMRTVSPFGVYRYINAAGNTTIGKVNFK